MLASDETYVLRDRARIALDNEIPQNTSVQLFPSRSPSSTHRVIVERRRQQASSSSLSTDLDELDEQDTEQLDTTPRPLHVDVFQSPQRRQPSPTTPATLAKPASASRATSAKTSHPPTSPDRTTSLRRPTSASSNPSSPSSKFQTAPMSVMPGYLSPPATGSANTTPRSRPRLGSSVGLEQEIDDTMPGPSDTDSAVPMVSFRQRMKKTSGFLRKFRKDNTPARRDREAAESTRSGSVGHAYSIGSNPSSTSLGRSGISDTNISLAALRRRESKASIGSLGGASTTGSISKSQHFTSTDGVAVPTIPERFMQPSTSSNAQNDVALEAVQESLPQRDVVAPSESQRLAPQIKTGLRVPSAPATMTEWDPATKYSLPQRSSSQGHVHERNKSLASSESSGVIRLAVQQLSSHMDDVWKATPAQEVQIPNARDARDAPSPKRSWGPSPQLPDLDINHSKQRSGNFMEEPDLVSSSESGAVPAAASKMDRSASASSNSNLSTQLSRESRNKEHAGLGIISQVSTPGEQVWNKSGAAQDGTESAGSPVNAASNDESREPITHLPQLLPTERSKRSIQPSPPPPTDSPRMATLSRSSRPNSIDAFAGDARRRTTDSGASLVSIRTFETAAESAGPGSTDAKVASFDLPSADSVQTASPMLSRDTTRSATSPSVASRNLAQHVSHTTNGHVHLDDERDDKSEIDEQEQSIRLVPRRSNTEDINLACDSAMTIITAPESPVLDRWAAVGKTSELSEQSSLQTERDRSTSRGGTNPALLSTRSVHRNSSPVSSPGSARTSFDAAVAQSVDGGSGVSPTKAASALELATKCWNEDPGFLKRDKIAEWLGGLGLVNRAARSYYFANFDFAGLRLDMAFRRLCDKLFLRAETQQIDRILAAFSQRYFECNPDSVLGSADVVHSVVFSILLLNTDLHIADLQERMTRQQFVKNTLGAIAESRGDAADVEDGRSSFSVAPGEMTRSTDAVPPPAAAQRRNSISSYLGSRSKHTSSATNLEASSDAHLDHWRPGTSMSGSKGKEAEVEWLLREIYAAVRSERILLPNPETGSETVAGGRVSANFSPSLGGGRRKLGNDRMTALKRGSIRGIQGLLGGIGSTPLVDGALSPNPSRSSVDSWGRTSQSLADRDRLLSPLPSTTLGFVSTLTQTIIKESMEEENTTAAAATTKEAALDEEDDDDQLALAGPPWAKEGSLTRKIYWESTGKRAKDKNWTEVFVVVSKGTLSMFRFDLGGSSAGAAWKGAKSRPSATGAEADAEADAGGAAFGGGNWLSSATCLGEISLAHSLANALPPPGYSKMRPHVFALTLPGGKMFFFQTGHEELVNEWVSTCNYWAARQSKEPLPGGVSNMEYGWNKVLPLVEDVDELDGEDTKIGTDSRSTFSVAVSGAASSKLDYASKERIFINEWHTPQLPSVASTLSEDRQLIRLEKQVAHIQASLSEHNKLRHPMLALYAPKSASYSKALANWEKKSNWLLQELVKYQSYLESLKHSADLKAERRAAREVDQMVRDGDEMLAQLQLSTA